jgi:hypothetical protein
LQSRWTRRSCDPFDGDVGDVHGVNCGSDLVSGNAVAPGFDVHSDSRGTLEHPMAKGAFEITSAVGEGVLMLRTLPGSEAAEENAENTYS